MVSSMHLGVAALTLPASQSCLLVSCSIMQLHGLHTQVMCHVIATIVLQCFPPGAEVVTHQCRNKEPSDPMEQIAKRLLQRCGTGVITVSDLNKVLKHHERGSPDVVRQVFQKVADLGFCDLAGAPLSEYRGGRGCSAPCLRPVWHTSTDSGVRQRAAEWGLLDLGTSTAMAEHDPQSTVAPADEPPFDAGMPLKRPAAPLLKRPAAPGRDGMSSRELVMSPCYVSKAPSSAAEVTRCLAPAFARTMLHGQPWQVCAYPHHGPNSWRLRCVSCHHKSCSWSGVAYYDPNRKTLTPYQFSGKTHGQPHEVGRGRKQAEQCRQFTCRESLAYTEAPTQRAFMDFVQRHFEKRAEVADSLFVTCKPRKRTRTSLTCSFYCRTHEHEDGKPCRWGGAAKLVFSAQQNTVQLKYEDKGVMPHRSDPCSAL